MKIDGKMLWNGFVLVLLMTVVVAVSDNELLNAVDDPAIINVSAGDLEIYTTGEVYVSGRLNVSNNLVLGNGVMEINGSYSLGSGFVGMVDRGYNVTCYNCLSNWSHVALGTKCAASEWLGGDGSCNADATGGEGLPTWIDEGTYLTNNATLAANVNVTGSVRVMGGDTDQWWILDVASNKPKLQFFGANNIQIDRGDYSDTGGNPYLALQIASGDAFFTAYNNGSNYIRFQVEDTADNGGNPRKYVLIDSGYLTLGGGSGTILNALPEAGGDQMCWDGSGASVIGDCTSSVAYKQNVQDLPFGLETVMNIRPRLFEWKDTGRVDLGFIAEEMEEDAPLLVTYREGDEPGGVKYNHLTALLTKAIQEQQQEIQVLQTELCKRDGSYAFCGSHPQDNIPPYLKDKTTYYRFEEQAESQVERQKLEQLKIAGV